MKKDKKTTKIKGKDYAGIFQDSFIESFPRLKERAREIFATNVPNDAILRFAGKVGEDINKTEDFGHFIGKIVYHRLYDHKMMLGIEFRETLAVFFFARVEIFKEGNTLVMDEAYGIMPFEFMIPHQVISRSEFCHCTNCLSAKK